MAKKPDSELAFKGIVFKGIVFKGKAYPYDSLYPEWFKKKYAEEVEAQEKMLKYAEVFQTQEVAKKTEAAKAAVAKILAEALARYPRWKEMDKRVAEVFIALVQDGKSVMGMPDDFWMCCEVVLAELEGRDPLG